MDTEDWRALIEYWIQDGRDIKYLDIPQDVADALGIELPLREETTMNDDATETEQDAADIAAADLKEEDTRAFNEAATKYAQEQHAANIAAATEDAPATTEPADNRSIFVFKKKKYFDGTTCGLKDCSRKLPVEGAYISGLKTTKSNNNGRLWYGPACEKCVTRLHPGGLKPDTLAMLAHQRNGKSDLALILDIEVGEIEKRLFAAGIDENGQAHAGGIVIQAGSGGEGNFDHVPMGKAVEVSSEAYTGAHLAIASQGIQGTLTFLGTFHIQTQKDMDDAGTWLKAVKSQWTDLDEMRKALGKPHLDATTKIQAQFKPVLAQFEQAEGIFKQKIEEAKTRAEATQQAALATAQAAHAAGNLQASGQAQQQAAAADITLPQGVHQRPNIVKYEVINPAEVPSDLFSWVIDNAKIEGALNTGVRQIPGVRIWEEASIQSRQS